MDLQQSDVHVCLEQQPSEKLSKTTLQFFRVRKGFFILPALFGGSKRQKKVSLKKGIGKSKTHDGLCKTIDDDNLKSNESYKCKHQKDLVENIPRSQCEFAQNTKDQKSRSLPRPKRSWRGFFNSIRRHKKNQNVEYENKKIIAMSCPHDYNPEILNAQAISDQSDTQCLKEFCKPNVPDLAKATCVNLAPLCNNADVIVFESNMVKQRSLTIETGEMVRNNNDPVRFIESPAANRDVCSRLKNPTDDSTLTIGRSDQINLIYGDVESLKSFDSLTGCGDIIADQDDDSIAESNVSGERSRSAIKRSSCHVTYQGGGEEMATPVEVDGNCLRNFWGNEVPEQITFTCNQSQGLLEQSIALMAIEETSTFNDIVHTNDGINAIKIPDTITYGQESALNRDEGYYNSTTPGSDEGLTQGAGWEKETDRVLNGLWQGDRDSEGDGMMVRHAKVQALDHRSTLNPVCTPCYV
ncbi:APC membrane recruitment protein 1 [Aplochiton taeniatus]